jgi:hypothetical protein
MHSIESGINQAIALARKLSNEYERSEHKTADDKIVNKIALALIAYSGALTYLIGCQNIGDAEITEASQILEPLGQEHVETLRLLQLQCLASVFSCRSEEDLKMEFIKGMCDSINRYADMGRKLLRHRELERKGVSAADIERLSKEPPQYIF